MHGNREILAGSDVQGRSGKAGSRNPMMYEQGKSDGRVVPGELSNNLGLARPRGHWSEAPVLGPGATGKAPAAIP